MSEDFVTSNCQAPLERMPWSSRKRLLVRLFLIIVATTVVVFLLLFPRHADVQVFDGRIEALGFEHSFGTNHILNGESKLAKRIKKDLSAVGLGVNISEHSLVTERDSHVFLLSYVAKSAELEPRRLCAELVGSGAMGLSLRQTGTAEDVEGMRTNYSSIWVLDAPLSNIQDYRLRVKVGSNGTDLAEFRLGH